MEELERSFERERLYAREERASLEAEYLSTTAALRNRLRERDETLKTLEEQSSAQLQVMRCRETSAAISVAEREDTLCWQFLAAQQQSANREAVLQRRLDEALDAVNLSDEQIASRNRQVERLR